MPEKLRALAMFCAEELEKLYPDARCSLDYGGDPWRLLVMARLSAQCTDERVNVVCRELFARFGTAAEMAEAPLSEIEDVVRPCGLFRMKASSIKAMSEKLVREYGGEIPCDIDELLSFPGVGRKIANLVLGDVYGLGGIVADTHFMRICGKIGFYEEGLRDPGAGRADNGSADPAGICRAISAIGRCSSAGISAKRADASVTAVRLPDGAEKA